MCRDDLIWIDNLEILEWRLCNPALIIGDIQKDWGCVCTLNTPTLCCLFLSNTSHTPTLTYLHTHTHTHLQSHTHSHKCMCTCNPIVLLHTYWPAHIGIHSYTHGSQILKRTNSPTQTHIHSLSRTHTHTHPPTQAQTNRTDEFHTGPLAPPSAAPHLAIDSCGSRCQQPCLKSATQQKNKYFTILLSTQIPYKTKIFK